MIATDSEIVTPNGRANVGAGTVAEGSVYPLIDGRYYIDIATTDGRWYRSIVDDVRIDLRPVNWSEQTVVDGREFKFDDKDTLSLR